MELSSCPQCTTRRNIPISFSFFLTNRFHLVLSCKHCNVRYVPTIVFSGLASAVDLRYLLSLACFLLWFFTIAGLSTLLAVLLPWKQLGEYLPILPLLLDGPFFSPGASGYRDRPGG